QAHPNLYGDVDGSCICGVDQADQARELQFLEPVGEDGARRLSPQSLTPVASRQQVRDFDFRAPIDRPREQPAAADELARLLVRRRPEPEAVLAVVDVDDPLQFLFYLLVRER